MHYRFYKIFIQDLKAAGDMLRRVPLTPTRQLWIKGILEDMTQKILEDVIEHSNEIYNELKFLLANAPKLSAESLYEHIQKLIVLLQQKEIIRIRLDVFLARPVSVTYFLRIYSELREFTQFDVRLIALDYHPTGIYQSSGQYDQLIDFLGRINVEYIPYSEYRIFDSLPDMIFYSFHGHSYIKPLHLQHTTLHPIINRIMFLEYTLTPADILIYDSSYSLSPFTWLQFRTSEFSYNSVSWGPQDVVTGHPLLDISHDIYSGKLNVAQPVEWRGNEEQITRFVWNITPNLHADTMINVHGTREKIKENLRLINRICVQHSSVLIILRPHPLCYLNDFQDLYNNLHNQVVLDRNPNALPALTYADAYIGDHGSLYMQFLPSERPALIFNVSPHECNFVFWTQTRMASSSQSIFSFVEQVVTDYDSMKRQVTEIDKYCIGPMDGKSSQRIIAAMLNKFYKEENLVIQKNSPLFTDALLEMERP